MLKGSPGEARAPPPPTGSRTKKEGDPPGGGAVLSTNGERTLLLGKPPGAKPEGSHPHVLGQLRFESSEGKRIT